MYTCAHTCTNTHARAHAHTYTCDVKTLWHFKYFSRLSSTVYLPHIHQSFLSHTQHYNYACSYLYLVCQVLIWRMFTFICVCVCVCVCIQASLNRKLTRCNGLHFPLEMCTANDVMGEWGIIPVMMLLLLDV